MALNLNENAFDWTPLLEPIVSSHSTGKYNYATLMLNHCFDSLYFKEKTDTDILKSNNFSKFFFLWNFANLRLTVDGGTNYLYDLQQMMMSHNYNGFLKNPDIITGDFDSIRQEVFKHFKRMSNIEVQETPDQDATDFTKALNHLLLQNLNQREINLIIVFYTSSGRVDQYLSILSTLLKFSNDANQSTSPCPAIISIDLTNSISFILNQGLHRIPVIKSAKWCSLVPLEGSSTLTTSGFRWNLNKHTLEFGKFISTSNEFSQDSDYTFVSIYNKSILFSSDFSL